MIIHNDYKMRAFARIQLYFISLILILSIISCKSCNLFYPDYMGQLEIEPFTPFTVNSNMLLCNIGYETKTKTYGGILVIDTEKDVILRKILFKRFIGGVKCTIIADNKIYISEEGGIFMESYTICAVYPEKGTFKQIKLEEPIPFNMYYNPITKLLIVTHGVEYYQEEREKRGGENPLSIINTENDTFVKTIYRDCDLIASPEPDGNWIGIDKNIMFSFNINNTNIIIYHTNQNYWATADWDTSMDRENGYSIIDNKLYISRGDPPIVRVYDIVNKKFLYEIPINGNPSDNILDCLAYYSPSNWIIVGGEKAVAVVDEKTSNVIKWITNYTEPFKLRNHKLYFHYMNRFTITIVGVTNDFQKIGEINLVTNLGQ